MQWFQYSVACLHPSESLQGSPGADQVHQGPDPNNPARDHLTDLRQGQVTHIQPSMKIGVAYNAKDELRRVAWLGNCRTPLIFQAGLQTSPASFSHLACPRAIDIR